MFKYFELSINNILRVRAFFLFLLLQKNDTDVIGKKIIDFSCIFQEVFYQRFFSSRAGVLFSLVLIFILVIIICIPPIFSYFDANQEVNTYVLIFLIIVFVFLGCAIVTFINYQHRQGEINNIAKNI